MYIDIFKVKNYKKVEVMEGIYASAGSFMLEMRNCLKREFPEVYFDNDETLPAKNIGCFIFGQPDKWKSVLAIRYENDDNSKETADIIVRLDKYRCPDSFKIGTIIAVKMTLEKLKEEGIIEDFEKAEGYYIAFLEKEREKIEQDKGFFYLTETYRDYKEEILTKDKLKYIVSQVFDNFDIEKFLTKEQQEENNISPKL